MTSCAVCLASPVLYTHDGYNLCEKHLPEMRHETPRQVATFTIDMQHKHIETLTEERDALRAMLKNLEWSSIDTDHGPFCVSCGSLEGRQGHKADCELARLLGRTT